tara:strand:+ start:474 stop:803 length:330 start_codon:yes stop_codon:yes gene_type:complete
MANDFKMVTAENIGTSVVTLYTAPASKTTIILELDIANITASTILMDVEITDNSAGRTVYLVKDAAIPSRAALKAINGQKIVLEAQDAIKVTSDTSTSADVVLSILEDV